MFNRNKTLLTFAMASAMALHCLHASAMGLVPETSMLFIKESDKGGSINLKNTDEAAQLLYVTIKDLPDDTGTHLLATQPVTRVEGQQTQHVRFVLQTDAPLKVEHMKRVVFEGIPQKIPGQNKIGFSIRQDLPVIIHPAGLPEIQDAWKQLSWEAQGNTLTLTNTTPYVVRFQPMAVLMPSRVSVKLTKAYILPGQTITADAGKPITAESNVEFAPVSRYGVQVSNYTAKLEK